MKKPKVFIAFFVVVLLLSVSIIFTITNAIPMFLNPIEKKCFSAIEDLKFLDEYVTDEIPLSKDKNLTSEPCEYWCKEIKYNGRKYKIRAYVFSNSEEAEEYVKKETGKIGSNNSGSLVKTKILPLSTRYIVYNENFVFYIKGGFAYNTFSKDLSEITKNFQEIPAK